MGSSKCSSMADSSCGFEGTGVGEGVGTAVGVGTGDGVGVGVGVGIGSSSSDIIQPMRPLRFTLI